MALCFSQRALLSGVRYNFLKMIVFWDVTPYYVVEIGLRFRSAYCLHEQGSGGGKHILNVFRVYQTTWRSIPEDSHLHTRRHENLKSYYFFCSTSHHTWKLGEWRLLHFDGLRIEIIVRMTVDLGQSS
jgi:hypothetical protein